MKITLKSLKICNFMSDETTCFSATVYVDGVKTCTAENEGHGGCNNYPWIYDRSMFDKVCEWAKTQKFSFEWSSGEKTYDSDLDMEISKVMDEMEKIKQYKKWCKKETLFRLEGDEEGSWRTVRNTYEPRVKKYIMDKYGSKVVEILNEKF